uniref:Uncharacterized protein n=1 Tax=Anguilla anguilla TaxID=7936 RepID=A0A0E9QHU9_ANGAN
MIEGSNSILYITLATGIINTWTMFFLKTPNQDYENKTKTILKDLLLATFMIHTGV